MKKRWIAFWLDKKSRFDFFFYTFLCLFLLAITPWHMENVEAKPGMLVNDFVLEMLPPQDVSVYIMSILYGIILIGTIWFIQYPHQFTLAVKTHFFASFLRYTFIYVISLEPPIGLIPLKDPFLEMFVYDNKLITKDLFFSGHAEAVFLIFLAVKNKYLKGAFAIGGLVLSYLLLLQHVHYTSDIIGAVIITGIIYHYVLKDSKKHLAKTPLEVSIPVE